MIAAVFDANLMASGLAGYHRDESTPGELLRRWLTRDYTLVMSEHLVTELTRALAKPYLVATTTPADRVFILTELRKQAAWTDLTTSVSGVATHPEDDMVLATATSANADYLVTGDKPLQGLRQYQSVPIISPREFLTLLDERTMNHDE